MKSFTKNNLPKLSINILGFNEKHFLLGAITSIYEQDYPNFEVTYIDNASTDGSEEFVRRNFPRIKVIQTGENRHYGPAHNKGIAGTTGELIAFLNSDLKLEPTYFSECIKALIADDSIAGVQGKMLRPKANADGKFVFDGTGLTINRSRAIKDRGQSQVDNGQYDTAEEVFAICGAAPVYRRNALEDIAINREVLDEDFPAFFDDSDLGWRLRHKGWKIWYQPTAILYHERGNRESPKNLLSLIKFRRKANMRTKQLTWKNNLYLEIKNDFGLPLRRDWLYILAREVARFGFILIFDIRTLAILPTVLRQLPNICRKRKLIKSTSVLGDRNIDNFITKNENSSN